MDCPITRLSGSMSCCLGIGARKISPKLLIEQPAAPAEQRYELPSPHRLPSSGWCDSHYYTVARILLCVATVMQTAAKTNCLASTRRVLRTMHCLTG
jgi:hypothetical protein